jgi:hypothetical protein
MNNRIESSPHIAASVSYIIDTHASIVPRWPLNASVQYIPSNRIKTRISLNVHRSVTKLKKNKIKMASLRTGIASERSSSKETL